MRREVIFCACFRVTSDEYVYEEESDKRVRAQNTFRTIHRWGIHNRENVLGFGSKRKRKDSLICMRMYRDTFPIAKKNLICRFCRKRKWHVLCKFLPFFVPSDFQDTPPHCQKQCKQILKIDLTPATLVQL